MQSLENDRVIPSLPVAESKAKFPRRVLTDQWSEASRLILLHRETRTGAANLIRYKSRLHTRRPLEKRPSGVRYIESTDDDHTLSVILLLPLPSPSETTDQGDFGRRYLDLKLDLHKGNTLCKSRLSMIGSACALPLYLEPREESTLAEICTLQ